MKWIFFILFPFSLYSQTISYYSTPDKYQNQNEDLFLPDTIFVAKGNTIRIYNDNVAYIQYSKTHRISYDWNSSIGYKTDSCYVINSTNINLGSYKLSFYMKNIKDQIYDSISCIIKVEPKAVIGNKGIMAIGNSLTYHGWTAGIYTIRNSLNITLTSIGIYSVDPYKNCGVLS